MENTHPSLLHLLLLILLLTMLTTTISPSPSPSPSPSQSPSTPPPPLEQMNNIIDALIGASDFTTWVSILSMSNPSMLPLTATLFIPHDNTFSNTTNTNTNHSPMDPLLFPYHVVPQRLTFSDLLLLPPSTRLPTLLPYATISVTDNSPSTFSLDATPITHPDLYSTPSLVVHGVANLLDYSLFRDGLPSPPSPEDNTPSPEPWKSGAASSWCTRNVAFLIFCSCFLLQQVIAR